MDADESSRSRLFDRAPPAPDIEFRAAFVPSTLMFAAFLAVVLLLVVLRGPGLTH